MNVQVKSLKDHRILTTRVHELNIFKFKKAIYQCKNCSLNHDVGFISLGQSKLKNYRVSAGPQQAYSVGFDYRDPDFWWFAATANFFADTYIDVSPLIRSENFATDVD